MSPFFVPSSVSWVLCVNEFSARGFEEQGSLVYPQNRVGDSRRDSAHPQPKQRW